MAVDGLLRVKSVKRLCSVFTIIGIFLYFSQGCSKLSAGPALTSISPARGGDAGGTFISVSGSNLSSVARIMFDDGDCTGVLIESDESVICQTPAHSVGSVAVYVEDAQGNSAVLDAAFEFVASWSPLTSTNEPIPKSNHSAVWTGSDMIIWGGSGGGAMNSGWKYNRNNAAWTSLAAGSVGRGQHSAVWTGSEMIVWGGTDGSSNLSSGEVYNVVSDSWVPITASGPPSARLGHTAVWTGDSMVVWGGSNVANGAYLSVGGKFNPLTGLWTTISSTGSPTARAFASAVWTGTEVIVWGGRNASGTLSDGARYNPETDTWTALPSLNAPRSREGHTAVWTGTEMVVWGGISSPSAPEYLSSGGRYRPSSNTWASTSSANAPSARTSHTAIWAGSGMLIWGGTTQYSTLSSGSSFVP